MLTNQNLPRRLKADNLNIDQRLKITSLTFSVHRPQGLHALYERVGDLAASIWCARTSMPCWRSSRRRRALS